MFRFLHKKEKHPYKELMKQGAIIIDVRSRQEFEDGHVATAINVPLDTLGTYAVSSIKNKDTHIITCCASGGRSSIASNALKALGYINVYNGGGWKSLSEEIE